MASTSTSTGETSNTDGKKNDRLNRLKELQLRMNEARKMNHQEVVEEDRRKKLPANFEQKRKFVEWEEQEEKKRKECEAKGEDYDRVKLLEQGADEAERWEKKGEKKNIYECEAKGEDYDRVKLLEQGADEAERWEKKKKKKNPDPGFSDYEAATYRQYQRNTKNMKPDLQEYGRQKNKMGENFYASKDTLGLCQRKDSEEAIDRMVTDLEKQIEKRAKYSRRRTHDEDADIDYINERNAKFNKKLERFYGTYTAEIKQNLERGTAV